MERQPEAVHRGPPEGLNPRVGSARETSACEVTERSVQSHTTLSPPTTSTSVTTSVATSMREPTATSAPQMPLRQASRHDLDLLSLTARQGLDLNIRHIATQAPLLNEPVGGRLTHFAQVWRDSFPDDDWLLSVISNGVTFDFPAGEPRPHDGIRQLALSQGDYAKCTDEVRDLLLKGATTVLSHDPGDSFINRVFPVKKKDGGTRPVIDCRLLNLHIPKEHFKMESLTNVKLLLRRRDWMTKIDIKDAYLHIAIHKAYRRFLRFYWDHQLFEFTALPFGVTSAPRLFTKVLRPVIGLLRRQGIRCVIYLDDLLIMASSEEEAKRHTARALELLTTLGFLINWKKSHLIPTQVLQFLGLTVDSHEMQFRVPEERLQSVLHALRDLQRQRRTTLRQLAHCIGKLSSLELAVLPVRLRTRELLRNLNHMKGSDWDKQIPLWQGARTEILWWIQHLREWNGRAIVLPPPTATVTTDASDSGWGAVLQQGTNEEHTLGFWSLLQKSYGNNVRELIAGGYGLLAFHEEVHGRTVELVMDNTTAVAYVNHMGGRKDFLSAIAEDLWDWCIGNHTIVTARHLAGKLNTTADALSRRTTDRTDWKLNPVVFQHLNQLWGPFTMDLFATALNRQLPTFVSWRKQPGAFATDAFSLNWATIGLAWANPPFIMIGRLLQKVRREQASLVVVVPFWETQAWWPLFVELLADHPVLLTPRTDLYLPGAQGNQTPLHAPNWHSIGALISGNKVHTRAFQSLRKTFYSTSGAMQRRRTTHDTGDSSHSGLMPNILPMELFRHLE